MATMTWAAAKRGTVSDGTMTHLPSASLGTTVHLDDESGEFARVPKWSLRCALAGGVLMDLALENRIDTDPEHLFLIDSTPVGDDTSRSGARHNLGVAPDVTRPWTARPTGK